MSRAERDAAFERAAMERALRAAERGIGRVEPNPPVGAVVATRAGEIVSVGWHSRYGGPHAEVVALARAGRRARGATLYVTLEPCSSSGSGKKTPPCVEAVAASGVARVVVGAVDPDPRHRGRGARSLRERGIAVDRSPLGARCRALLARFARDLADPLPLVEAKWAMSLDGRSGLAPDEHGSRGSAVLSSPRAYAAARALRAECDAIVIGASTVLADDPELLAPRGGRRPAPLRVVIDGRLRPELLSSRLVAAARSRPLAVVTTAGAPASRARLFEGAGVRVIRVRSAGRGRVDLLAALRALKAFGARKVFIEGGPRLVGSALAAGAVERLVVSVAPRLLGGRRRPGAVRAPSAAASRAIRALRFAAVRVSRIGDDLVLRCERRT